LAELAPLVKRPADLTLDDTRPYIQVSSETFNRSFDFEDEVSHFKWALAASETNRRVGLHLWRQERPDLLMVYIEGTDSISHLFGHLFRAEDL
jgi:predicted AlkP superfamily pyrophosphatase or phosphodiesterase